MEPMLADAAKKRPSNPIEFCIKWLQKYEGKKPLTQRTVRKKTKATPRAPTRTTKP